MEKARGLSVLMSAREGKADRPLSRANAALRPYGLTALQKQGDATETFGRTKWHGRETGPNRVRNRLAGKNCSP